MPVEQVGTEVAQEECKEEAVSPIGDFIALVGGFAAVVFAAAINWYTPSTLAAARGGKALKGVNAGNPVGVICFIVGAAVFIFAGFMLIGRFINPNFRLVRSPGWAYAAGSAVIFMACIVGLALPPNIMNLQAGVSAGVVVTLFAGAAIAVGGLLKF
jgi:hypothetical protein